MLTSRSDDRRLIHNTQQKLLECFRFLLKHSYKRRLAGYAISVNYLVCFSKTLVHF